MKFQYFVLTFTSVLIHLTSCQGDVKSLLRVDLKTVFVETTRDPPSGNSTVILSLEDLRGQTNNFTMFLIGGSSTPTQMNRLLPYMMIIRRNALRNVDILHRTLGNPLAMLFRLKINEISSISEDIRAYDPFVFALLFTFKITIIPLSNISYFRSFNVQLNFLLVDGSSGKTNSISSISNFEIITNETRNGFVCMNDDYFKNNILTYSVFVLCSATRAFFDLSPKRMETHFDLSIIFGTGAPTSNINVILRNNIMLTGLGNTRYNLNGTRMTLLTSLTDNSFQKFSTRVLGGQSLSLLTSRQSLDIRSDIDYEGMLRICRNGGYCQIRGSSYYCSCFDVKADVACTGNSTFTKRFCTTQNKFNVNCVNFPKIPPASTNVCDRPFKCVNGVCDNRFALPKCLCTGTNFTGELCEVNCSDHCDSGNCIQIEGEIKCLCNDTFGYGVCLKLPSAAELHRIRVLTIFLFSFVLAFFAASIGLTVWLVKKFQHELIWSKPRMIRDNLRMKSYRGLYYNNKITDETVKDKEATINNLVYKTQA